ncbi:hypothetical protein Tco_0417955 [Tanacetum coccineum]
MVLATELQVLFVVLLVGLSVVWFVVVFVEEKWVCWSHGAEGKDSFVKCDMTGNNDFVGVQVKAPISTMIVRVPEKDRWCGTRGKFVRWKGVRVTKASKHVKVGVRGWFVKLFRVRGVIVDRGGRKDIKYERRRRSIVGGKVRNFWKIIWENIRKRKRL